MDEEKPEDYDYGVNKIELLELMQEFIESLNVPNTHHAFTQELKQKNLIHLIQKQEEKETRQKVEQLQEMGKEDNGKQMCEKISIKQMEGMVSKYRISQILDQIQKRDQSVYRASWADKMEDSQSLQLVKENKRTPRLIQVFSAYENLEKIEKIHIPIHNTLRIEARSSKDIRFMSISPRQHNLVIVDMDSNLTVYNICSKKMIHEQKKESDCHITSLKWISGDLLIIGKSNGNIDISIVCLDLKILTSIKQVHDGEVLDIFEYKDFLFTIGSDHQISKISKNKWNQINTFTTYLLPTGKNSFTSPLCRIVKIKDEKLEHVCFLMDRIQGKVWMFDEISKMEKEIFKVNYHCRGGVISEMLAHQETKSIIISISGKSKPEIYQIFPLNNEVILRVSGTHIVNVARDNEFLSLRQVKKENSKSYQIFFSYYSNGSVLVFTCTSEKGKIYHVSLRNWRILHTETCSPGEEGFKDASMQFGGIMSAGGDRGVEEQKQIIFQHEVKRKSKEKTSDTIKSLKKQKLQKEVFACLNSTTGSIEIYETEKSELEVIKSEHERLRRMLSLGANIPRGPQGFLTLIQNIRENYNVYF